MEPNSSKEYEVPCNENCGSNGVAPKKHPMVQSSILVIFQDQIKASVELSSQVHIRDPFQKRQIVVGVVRDPSSPEIINCHKC